MLKITIVLNSNLTNIHSAIVKNMKARYRFKFPRKLLLYTPQYHP